MRQFVKAFLILLIVTLSARFCFQLGFSTGYATAEGEAPRHGVSMPPISDAELPIRPPLITPATDDNAPASVLAASQMRNDSGS